MRTRRLRKHPATLEISAFLNLIVVLVPFLLSTAVFTRISVLDLTLPAKSTGALEQLKADASTATSPNQGHLHAAHSR